MIKLVLEQITPSNNKLLRMHYRERRRLKESYMWELLVAMNENNVTPDEVVAGDRKKLMIISYRKKLLDPDNFIGGLKLLIDGLVDMRLIHDDSPEYLELQEAGQKIDLKNPRTEIYISEN